MEYSQSFVTSRISLVPMSAVLADPLRMLHHNVSWVAYISGGKHELKTQLKAQVIPLWGEFRMSSGIIAPLFRTVYQTAILWT